MEIQFKKTRTQPLNERITVPINAEMKNGIESLKRNYHVDVNEMVRDLLDQTIKKVESGEYQRPG